MTRDQIKLILARCASFDQRTVGQADVTAWHLALGDFTYAEADKAVIEYYKEERDRIMPSDIRSRCWKARELWTNAHPGPDLEAPWEADQRRELEAKDEH
jgi:hypothetical protein